MEKLLELLEQINPEADFAHAENLVNGGILDSIGIVELISAIEDEYGVSIEPEQIDPDNFQSAESIWRMIEGLLQEKK